MPIYEYGCRGCGKRFSVLVLKPGAAGQTRCPKCGAADLERLMSRFATAQSEELQMEKLADPSAVARWAKKMGREIGDEGGEGFDETADQTVEGEARGNDGKAGDDEL